MPSDTSTLPAVHAVPFADLAAFPRLFVDYCTDFASVASFYGGDYRTPEGRAAAARRAADAPRNRDALADALLDQHEAWGLDDAVRQNIEALRHPETVVVVTGQQVGLFTGPLYAFYKTLTTLHLARQLAEETGRTVVPVFWLPGEDHDLAEVAATTVLRRNTPVTLRYTGHTLPETGNLGPVGRLAFTDQITDVVDALDEALAPTDFKDALMAQVRDAYRPGATFQDAFARLLRSLLPDDAGLVFVSPDDARLKRLAAPLFRREVDDYATATDRLEAVSEQLAARYHTQVHVRPTNLFLLEADGRHPLDADGEAFVLRGTDRRFTAEQLHALLDEAPERFSPNVMLRPLMQDLLLPTTAYVAGPGELSYFAQLKPLYEWAEVPMPFVHPRVSVTLMEGKVQKVLDKYDLTLPDFSDDLEVLFQRLVVDGMSVDVEGLFQAHARHLHEAVNALKPDVETVDRTLVKSIEATRAAFMKEWGRLQDRVVRAEKRNQEAVREQLEKAYVNLQPHGRPQERVLNVLYYVNKYGPGLLADLAAVLPTDTTAHQVVAL